MTTTYGIPASRITIPAASIIPQGVGAPPPPGLDPKKGKLMCIKVRMLDDTVGVFHLGHKATGQALFDEVCRHLNLLECDYFGLEFLDCFGNRCWLDKEKSILKQITLARSDARFYFVVKFYTPTPADLEEEYTRYLFALQIKRDLASGEFVCNENTAALMASYIVQAECGDFSSDDYHDHSYLSPVHFVPNQSAEFEKKVMENHKKLIGMGPAESDLALLETARRSEFYGVKFHSARDIEGTPVTLAVLHLGIKVYHHLTCASTFSWAKLRKLSFKRKKLLIKLLPESCAYYKDMIEFSFETRNECKMFWKKAVENHTFFRCSEVLPASRSQSKFFTKGSSFRYTGRTQKQLIDYVREHHKRREPFTRPLHSAKTKYVSDEKLLPTPVSSLPGTLTRENGNFSIHAMPDVDQSIYDGIYQSSVTDMLPDHRLDAVIHVNGQEPLPDDETGWKSIENNNEQYGSIPVTMVIPPTPDTPQLKRKVVRSSTPSSVTRQQITFHFPVTEISPDSQSSASDFGPEIPAPHAIGGDGTFPVTDLPIADEWAAPPTPSSPTFPPLSPGVEGEEDNVSEDSYHLAEQEQIARRLQQQSAFISTSLPSAVFRGGAHGCTCIDQQRQSTFSTFGNRPATAASLDMVFPITSSKESESGQEFPAVVTCSPPTSPPLERSSTQPIESAVAIRAKPVPPPKPKMGLMHLERSARGDYGSGSGHMVEPVVISRSTIITKEVTVKKIQNIDESNQDSIPMQETKVRPSAGIKRVDFAMNSSNNVSVDSDKVIKSRTETSIEGRSSPSPPITSTAAFPSDTDSISAGSSSIPQSTAVPVIEVQSEECPEIKHKFVNGDIPYILHVRHVKKPGIVTENQQPAPAATLESTQDQKPSSRDISEMTSVSKGVVGRRKSFDLVPRKRLPSPASFSSQDHSVSPDSEHDVAGYVSRFRGHGARKSNSQSDVMISRRQYMDSKRTDPRRMTQPIQPKALTSKPKPARSQPCVSGAGIGGAYEEDSGDELVGMEIPSLHEGMDILENLPDTDRVSIGSTGDVLTASSHVSTTINVRFAPDAPFIDERTSSESPKVSDSANVYSTNSTTR